VTGDPVSCHPSDPPPPHRSMWLLYA